MTILICSCQGRKTILKKFLSNYNHIQVIQTLHFVFELTSYVHYITSVYNFFLSCCTIKYAPYILSYWACGWCWCELVHCPHAHSILIFTSPLFTRARVFIDAYTVLLNGTAWLGRPSSYLGTAGFRLGFWVTCRYVLNTGRLIFTVYKTHIIAYIAYLMIPTTYQKRVGWTCCHQSYGFGTVRMFFRVTSAQLMLSRHYYTLDYFDTLNFKKILQTI
jgi:hypothetical protein